MSRHEAVFTPEPSAGRGGLPQLWGRQGFWQIRLRWAVAPVMLAAVVVGRALGFEFEVVPIVAIALASPLYNGLFALVFGRYRERLEADAQLDRLFTVIEVVVDYAAMFLLIHFTGGVFSPLMLFLIFHVIIAAIQFSAATAFALAGVAAGGLWVMLLAQLQGLLTSNQIAYRGVPLESLDRPAYAVVFLVLFSATLFLTAGMVSKIVARLRARVGDLAEVTSDLVRANREAERLMEERTQFMLEVAHNLRAPLAASLSIVDLLSAGYVGELEEKQREHLSRLETRLANLNQTIGELLAIARTRDRSREIEDVIVDPAALAAHTRELFEGPARRKGLGFSMRVADSLPEIASGAGMLERVMENLVSNAVKYTPEGGEVEVVFEPGEAGAVRIVVRDTGIGIPAQERDRLFQEFFRASNARKSTSDGTGLGLVLVQQAVERQGGTLDLASEEGGGTTVTLDLPVRPPSSASAPAGPESG